MKKDENTQKLLIDVIKKLQDYKTDLLLKEATIKLEKLSSHKKNIKKDKSSPQEFIKKKMK